jgi:hypothetical protein
MVFAEKGVVEEFFYTTVKCLRCGINPSHDPLRKSQLKEKSAVSHSRQDESAAVVDAVPQRVGPLSGDGRAFPFRLADPRAWSSWSPHRVSIG